MKIYFHVNKQPLNGYNNINLATDVVDFQKLNNLCEPSECTEMILDEVLEYIQYHNIKDFISKLSSRIRLNGNFVIYFYHGDMILNAFENGIINHQQLNNIIFGRGKISKNSIINLDFIEQIIKDINFVIQSIEINNYKVILVAKRVFYD
jgi:hypothetical protein